MSLSDIDQKIIAEGERIRGLAHKGALEARRDALLAELKQIEADLAQYSEKAVKAVEKATDAAVNKVEEVADKATPRKKVAPKPASK